jgi:hypothetical protein
MGLEIAIVSKLRKEIKAKKARMASLGGHRSSNLKRTQNIMENDKKKEKRAILMVVSNNIINFTLRFPEFFSFF